MKVSVVGLAAAGALLLSGCPEKERAAPAPPQPVVESVYTDLAGAACRKEADKSDPNETPYLVCPGAAGFTLIVRRVDAGRKSVDVVDAAQHASPLKLEEFVTRHMFTLDDKAEWRVVTRDGRQTPIALIVGVQAHEDNQHPQKVTHSYLAVAKTGPDQACVTESITAGTKSAAEVRSAADSARERRCAAPLPPMKAGGSVIR